MPSIEKYIGGMYNEFYAIIVPERDLDKRDKGCGAIVKIYADDVLVYTSPEIVRKSDDIQVQISITGVKYLKIQLEPSSSREDYMNEYDVLICDAIVK